MAIMLPPAVPVRMIVPWRLIAQALPLVSVTNVPKANVPTGMLTTPPVLHALNAASMAGPLSVAPFATAP